MTNPGNPAQPILPSELVQIAYRVPNLEAACLEWARKVGAGPFLIRKHMAVEVTHDGAPAIYDHSAAFGQWGPVMLELVELHECEPAAMRAIVEHDTPGQVNHFACFVEDIDAASAALDEQGFPIVMDLVSSSGMRVHFHDARELIGAVLEIYEGSEHIRDHYARVKSLSENWDGSDVVRYM